jgi:hypothetical protein
VDGLPLGTDKELQYNDLRGVTMPGELKLLPSSRLIKILK